MSDLHTKWIIREPSVAWIVDGPKPEIWINNKPFLNCSSYDEAAEILRILLSTVINPEILTKFNDKIRKEII